MMSKVYGVYRVFKNGRHQYVSRSATHSEALAKDIARGLSDGEIVMPDGRVKHVTPHPHIVKEI